MRFLLLAALSLPFAARAGAGDPCDDDFNECKESCLIEFGGSIRDEVKKKYGKCMKKCTKTADLCTERAIETRTNNLDEGALDKSPGSSEVDENGMPERTTGRAKKTEDAPPRRDDDVRAADPKRDKPEKAKADKPGREERAEKPKKDEPRDEAPPKSTRTKLEKVEPAKDEPKPREERAEAREDKQEIKVELKPERRSGLDEDLRDDGARRDEAKPKKREEPRREEPLPPPKRKEEDHDDLRNY